MVAFGVTKVHAFVMKTLRLISAAAILVVTSTAFAETVKDHEGSVGHLSALVEHVGQHGKHGAAKRQGWKNGDILIEIGGNDKYFIDSQLVGLFIEDYDPGDKVPATIVRGSKRMKLQIPIQ